MNNWKNAVALSLLTVSLTVVGCSNPSASQSTTKNESDTKKKEFTLEVLSHPNYSVSSSEAPRANYMKEIVAKYEKDNPGIKLKSSTLASSNTDEAMAKLYEQAASGRAPDLAMIDGFVLNRFKDQLQPLDPYLEKAGIKADDFFPFAQQVVKGKDGKIYGLYFTTDVRVMFYRKDLVPNPPKTFDELLAIGTKLAQQGYTPLLISGGRGEGSSITSLWPQFWSQGGELIDDKGNSALASGPNKDKMIKVLNFYKTALDSKVLPQRVSTYKRENDMNSEIPTGKIAMFFGGNWQAATLKEILPKEEFEKWDIATIPTFNANDKPVTAAGGWTFGVFTKDPAKQEAAVKFLIDAYVGDKGMARWNTIAGSLPTRKSIYEGGEYEKSKFNDIFKKQLDSIARVRPAEEVYGKISAAMQVALSDVTSGNKSPEAAMNEALDVLNKK